jgi:DNA-binding response OmpR family regulator
MFRYYLEESGFKVDSFNDAFEALENFTTGLYDLILLDVKMPGMTGFSLYSEIRKLDGVSICFLTAANDVYYETLKKCYPNIDENCILHKPVDDESL